MSEQPKATPEETPRKKHAGGRPVFDGKPEAIIIQKLEQVWAIGGTDAEAAFYADISKAALCDYLQRHPKVAERKESLKTTPFMKARQSIFRGLDESEFALKFMERKLPDEFAPKNKIEHSGDAHAPVEVNHRIDEKSLEAIGNAIAGSKIPDSK